jgi:hypothetical protein
MMSFDASAMRALQLFMNLQQQYLEDGLKRLLESTHQIPTPPASNPENKSPFLEVCLCFLELMFKDDYNDNDNNIGDNNDIGDVFANEDYIDDNHIHDECGEDSEVQESYANDF